MVTEVSLVDLEVSFLRWDGDPSRWWNDQPFADANGVMFACPKCYVAADCSLVGVHQVLCWSPDVPLPPAGPPPAPGRWRLVGTGIADLSLVNGSSSVLLTSGCRWHGFVKNGVATL